MKKVILALSSAALCLSLCACGDIQINASQQVADALIQAMESAAAPQSAATSSSAAVPQAAEPAIQQVAAQEVPTVTPLPAQATAASSLVYTPIAEQASANPALYSAAESPTVGAFGTTTDPTRSGIINILKHPTSETLPVYNDAYFIAHASNATSITWLIANSDASIIYTAADAPYYIYGLSVRGAYSDTLVLENVPLSMNGWKVQAKFDGPGGPVYSNVAYLNIYQVYYRPCKPVVTPVPVNPSGHVPGTGTSADTGIIINANNSNVDVNVTNTTTNNTITYYSVEQTNSNNETTTVTEETITKTEITETTTYNATENNE